MEQQQQMDAWMKVSVFFDEKNSKELLHKIISPHWRENILANSVQKYYKTTNVSAHVTLNGVSEIT